LPEATAPDSDGKDHAPVSASANESLNSVISIDLLDFDTKIYCPLCAAIGDEKMISVITLSDHMGEHKYAAVLAEKMTKNKIDEDAEFEKAVRDSLCDATDQLEINVVAAHEEMAKKIEHVHPQPIIVTPARKQNTESAEIDCNDLNPD
jgi:hypothetical protein